MWKLFYYLLMYNCIAILLSVVLQKFKVSSTKKVESGLVGYEIAIRIRRFPVQSPLGAQLVLGAQPHYKTPGDLQVSEDVLSRITLTLPRDGQIAVKKNLNFFSEHF